MHAEYLQQVECKNKWVQHMKLRDDSIRERKGVVVRALEGTAGKSQKSDGRRIYAPFMLYLRLHLNCGCLIH